MLINGTAYGWSDIEINILGAAPAGIKAVSYSDEQEKVNNYGIGNEPISRGYGAIKPEGSITMEMSEILALQAAAPNKDLKKIPPFTVVVSYAPEGGVVVSDVLEGVEFLNNMRGVKQGDTTVDVELKLILSGVKWDK